MKQPTEALAFSKWLAEHRATMPAELAAKADRARAALDMLRLKQPSDEATAAVERIAAPALAAFLEAWAAHQSDGAH